MTTFHLVRHGQASFGAANYDQLSELGTRQCTLLGEWLSHIQLPVQRIVAGTMQRHQQSAAAFWQGYGAPQELDSAHWDLDPGFNEFDHEQLLHAAFPELADPQVLAKLLSGSDNPRATFQDLFVKGFARWMSAAHDADYAESWPAFKSRIAGRLNRLRDEPADHVLIFTSGGPISAMCQQLMAIPDSHAMNLLAVLMNSSISKVVNRHGALQLVSVNNVAHLDNQADRSLISYR